MFCPNCGKENGPGTAFCQNCGTKLAPAATAQAGTPENPNESAKPAVLQDKNRIIGIGVCAFAAIAAFGIIFGIISSLFSDNAEDVALKYCEAVFECEYADAASYLVIDYEKFIEDVIDAQCKVQDISKKEAWEAMTDSLGDDYDIGSVDDYLDALSEEAKEDLEKSDFKYEIDGEPEEIDEDELKEKAEAFETNLSTLSLLGLDVDDYFSADEVSEGYIITVIKTFEIDGEEDEEEDTFTVVKYDGDWKILDMGDF